MATRIRAGAQLAPHLEAVLIRLCESAGRSLSITQAVKLPYLVDVLAQHVLGKPITHAQHEAWQYGVVTAEAWHFLSKSPSNSPFEVTPVMYSEEIAVGIVEGATEDLLEEAERRIVAFVAEEYACIPAGELGQMTKRMNPAIRSWGSNHRADVSEQAYERMLPAYLEMAEAVEALSLDQLRRESRVISSPEDAIA